MNRLLHTWAIVVLLVVATACGNDAVRDDSYTHSLTDVVTYVGTDATTGNAQYELVGRDLSGSTMLQGNVKPAEGMKPLQRVLLRYGYADDREGATQRSIKVYGTGNVFTDSLRYTTASLDKYARHPVKMRSAWRTGDFINLHCQAEYTGKARTLMLLIDDATRNLDTVQCYLHHDLRTDTAYQWRECYASFNVGNVWKRTQCKTMRIHVNDATAGDKCYDFDRINK